MHAYLFNGLSFGPRIVERMVELIPASRYDEKTNPERFTLREAIAHLADWEPILRGRIEAAVKTSGAPIAGIDEGQRAVDLGYETWDVAEQLRFFAKERQATIEFLRTLSPDDWKKTIVHNEKGEQTVYDQANQLLGHDLYHIDHLTEFFTDKIAGTW